MALVLYQFNTDWDGPDVPNVSPFCAKVGTFMRLAGLEYELAEWSPMKAPNGKAPVVELDGRLIADSSVILRELTQHFDVQLDAPYSDDELARATPVLRMLEEHFYWALLHTRWLDDAGWKTYHPVIASSLPLPWPFAGWLTSHLRRGVAKSAHGHGLSRHTPEEVSRRAVEDLRAVEAFMGDHDFLLGSTPCSIDATVFAFLNGAANPAFPGLMCTFIEESEALTTYLHRVRALAWPKT